MLRLRRATVFAPVHMVVVLAAAAALAGCGLDESTTQTSPEPSSVTTEGVLESEVQILSISWGEAGLVAGVDDPSEDLGLARVDVEGGSLSTISTPRESRTCDHFNFVNPVPLDRQHVAAVVDCIRRDTLFAQAKVVQVDVGSGETRPLFDTAWARVALRDFGLGPGARYAIASEGSLICNSLAKISDMGWSRPVVEPAELIPIQGQRGSQVDSNAESCDGLARAGTPAVSADGTLAFVSSTSAADKAGIARLEEPGDLYTLPRSTSEAKAIASNVLASTVRWSPDGSTLAVSGTIGGQEGLFLIDLSSGETTQFSDVAYRAVAWSPDGNQLAVVRPAGDSDDFESILEILSL